LFWIYSLECGSILKILCVIITIDFSKAEEVLRIAMAYHEVPQGEEIAKATEIIEKTATRLLWL